VRRRGVWNQREGSEEERSLKAEGRKRGGEESGIRGKEARRRGVWNQREGSKERSLESDAPGSASAPRH